MPTRKIIRQGDVILRELTGEEIENVMRSARPVSLRIAELRQSGRLGENENAIQLHENVVVTPDSVVIRGETGHSHVISGVKTYLTWHGIVIQVEKPVTIKHEQHPEIEIPPGIYVITHVQDYALRRHHMFRFID